jgi:D-proline reductase (dithiol) PrdB
MNHFKLIYQDYRLLLQRRKKFDPRQIKDRILARVYQRYPAFFRRWAKTAEIIEFSDIPWTPFDGEISYSRIALITTGGVHLSSQKPFNMKDPSGDPSFREIPANALSANLCITHDYYDHSDADKDINIVFPIERIRLLKRFGEIGDINTRHFSFMGHITGPHIETLLRETAPRVAGKLKEDGVNVALLTPA